MLIFLLQVEIANAAFGESKKCATSRLIQEVYLDVVRQQTSLGKVASQQSLSELCVEIPTDSGPF